MQSANHHIENLTKVSRYTAPRISVVISHQVVLIDQNPFALTDVQACLVPI